MITNERRISENLKQDGIDLDYDEVFLRICKNIRITIDDSIFVYFIDDDYVMDTTKGYRYENLTPAYDKILDFGLEALKYAEPNTVFKRSYNNVCDGLILLANRIVDLMMKNKASDMRIAYFENMRSHPASHFKDAVQRMLFINQLFWQTDHRLVGLGAWDSFLYPYYEKDIESGVLDRKEALHTLEEVFRILHRDYTYKSNVLMGDTGQIFVLGRSDINGHYLCNDLTYLFIEAMKNVQQPDPKCLLRINRKTPRDLIKLSLESISTGIGAPLLANDEVVIPCIKDFGVDESEACEWTTSACWEPLIGGKSSSNNNRTVLNYLRALDNLLKREDLSVIDSYEKLLDTYEIYLRRNLRAVKRVMAAPRFQYNPLLSVFTYGCFESGQDVSWGGAKYRNIGATSVAMGNLIDSLLNIRFYVYEKKKYSLLEVKEMLIKDYDGYEDVLNELKYKSSVYGSDDPEVIELVRRFTTVVAEEIGSYESYLGERMKSGLSGSAYLDAGKLFGASFDGRRAGEPFVVHISNEDQNSFTEIVNFASKMKYTEGMFNGNVLDFMTSPSFIIDNLEKMVDFIYGSIRSGFFEMQMNVVSSEQMIEAKKNPDLFPNLIVRVWGFSSYFNDLPDEYKDVLIKRALKNERKSA